MKVQGFSAVCYWKAIASSSRRSVLGKLSVSFLRLQRYWEDEIFQCLQHPAKSAEWFTKILLFAHLLSTSCTKDPCAEKRLIWMIDQSFYCERSSLNLWAKMVTMTRLNHRENNDIKCQGKIIIKQQLVCLLQKTKDKSKFSKNGVFIMLLHCVWMQKLVWLCFVCSVHLLPLLF